MQRAKDRVRIGILSHAHGHSNVYCRVMQGMDDVELVATWDDNEERGRKAARDFGIEYRREADDVIADPRIDAVIVTTETNRHAEYVERAAAAASTSSAKSPWPPPWQIATGSLPLCASPASVSVWRSRCDMTRSTSRSGSW